MLEIALTHLAQTLDARLRDQFAQDQTMAMVAPPVPTGPGQNRLVLSTVSIAPAETASYDGLRPRPGGAPKDPVELEVTLLLAAPFDDQVMGLRLLGAAMAFLVAHPLIDQGSEPALPPGLTRISIALLKLDLATQCALWQALGTPLQPALSYRMRIEGDGSWIAP